MQTKTVGLECRLRTDQFENEVMARRLKELKELKLERPPRLRLSAKESLKRTKDFDKRKEQFIAAVRKGKN